MDKKQIRSVVFLGNPGKQYEKTRHNVGQQIIKYLSFYRQISWQEKFKGKYARVDTISGNIIFLKPETYMNNSGESIQKMVSFFKFRPDQILIVHDDIELDFGIVSCKDGGGLSGHNGLKSAAAHLSTKAFHRLRIGVGRPSRGAVNSYVLSRFSSEEEVELPDILTKASVELERYLN